MNRLRFSINRIACIDNQGVGEGLGVEGWWGVGEREAASSILKHVGTRHTGFGSESQSGGYHEKVNERTESISL